MEGSSSSKPGSTPSCTSSTLVSPLLTETQKLQSADDVIVCAFKMKYYGMVVESQFSSTRREYPARSCTLCPTFCSVLERLDQVMPPHQPCCKAKRNRKCNTYPELLSRLGYQTPEGCTLQDLRVSNISSGALGNNNVDVSTFPCNSVPPSGLSIPVNITHCQASLHTILSLIVTH